MSKQKTIGDLPDLPPTFITGLDFALWALEQAGYEFVDGRTAALHCLIWQIGQLTNKLEQTE